MLHTYIQTYYVPQDKRPVTVNGRVELMACLCVQQAQLSLQEGEIQALRASLAEEQRRFYCLHDDSKTNTGKLQSQMEQQQQQLLDSNSTTQKLRVHTVKYTIPYTHHYIYHTIYTSLLPYHIHIPI